MALAFAQPGRSKLFRLLPLLLVSAIYLVLMLRVSVQRVREPWPLSPWESAITVDAWRMNHHQPVYADPATDHATHMYGPLVTLTAAIGERVGGVDVRVPRVISLLACAALAVLCGVFLSIGRSRWIGFLIGTLTFFQFYRVFEWSTEARPDAAATLFGFLGLICLYRATQVTLTRKILVWTAGGSTLLLIGFFFKQPAMVLGVVPPIAVFLNRSQNHRGRRLLISLMPLAWGAIALLVLRAASPWMYFYMVRVPASYPVVRKTWIKAWMEWSKFDLLFLGGLLLLVILLVRRRMKLTRVDGWLLITIAVTSLFGTMARAKVGGGFNSLLPATVAMAAFAIRAIDAWLDQPLGSGVLLVSLLSPLLVIADFSALLRVFVPGETSQIVRHGDADYPRVIDLAARLRGKVISPDDPTIALRAKGYAGRCGDCELDAHHRTLPYYALDELKQASYVIQTHASRNPTIDDAMLQRLGFRRAAWDLSSQRVYRLWARE